MALSGPHPGSARAGLVSRLQTHRLVPTDEAVKGRLAAVNESGRGADDAARPPLERRNDAPLPPAAVNTGTGGPKLPGAAGGADAEEPTAVRLQRLAVQVHDIAASIAALAQSQPTEDVIARAKELQARQDQVRAQVAKATAGQDQAGLIQLLDAWRDKPADLLLMIKVGEEAPRLAAIVRALQSIGELVRE
jgi:hypothetical protein